MLHASKCGVPINARSRKTDEPRVLALNGGSSSIRFAVFDAGATSQRLLAGKIDRIGTRGTTLSVADATGKSSPLRRVAGADHRAAVEFLLEWLQAQPVFASVAAVGHRIVHGMKHTAPERVTPRLLAGLRRIVPYDPDHLPRELALVEALGARYPRLPQVACFDTAFHRAMPRVAKLLPIPRRFAAKGVERYGFHGLSYEFLLEELARLGDPAATKGRVILAHLGNGASLAAVRDGRSIDTSMGFTPAAGLVMSTRSGDLDPGVLAFLARTEGMTPAQFDRMVNHESGLLGISATSSDVRDLLAREKRDPRAADALALFCYQAKKWIGAYAAALGGVDTLVFAGGIGENAPLIRARICDRLEFLGIALDRKLNAGNAPLISRKGGRVAVRVIPTDEEAMIARSVDRVLGLDRSE
jgi:acetate kinase